MNARDLIDSARMRVHQKHPYISSVLMSLRLVEKPGIGTLAVDAGWRLYYDPATCQAWGVELLAGVVCHEVWHVLRDHFTRMGHLDPKMSNIAQDLEINSDLIGAGWKLPDGGMVPKLFKFKAGLLAEEYYGLLDKLPKITITIGVTSGKCGGCAGNPHDFEEGVSDTPPLQDFEKEVIRRQAAHDVANNIGVGQPGVSPVPSSLRAWAESELKPPTIDWRRQLAGMVRRSITQAAGAVDHTYRKPSRRGTGLRHYLGANAPILPSLYRPVPRVAIILDASGSMCGGPAESARSEVMGVVRAVGCSLDVFIADTQVADVQRVASLGDVIKLNETGGGTDIGHAVKEVGNMRKHDLLIVLTDGETPWHSEGEVRANVIVAITPGGEMPPDWMKAVQMT